MTDPDIILLCIRGRIKAPNLAAACALHNGTAGHPDGVRAARALGDLSHNVFVPLADAADAASELLFLDLWNSQDGLGKFFSDPQVQAGAGAMFETRDPVIGAASGARGFALPTPAGKAARFVGLLRAPVKSREAAVAAFDALEKASINAGRLLGQVSHQVYVRVDALEVIAVDTWMDAEGMEAHYTAGSSERHLAPAFAAAPTTSLWKQPAGAWVEW